MLFLTGEYDGKVNFWIIPQSHIQGDREVGEALYIESQDTKKVESQYAIPAMRKQRKNDGKRA